MGNCTHREKEENDEAEEEPKSALTSKAAVDCEFRNLHRQRSYSLNDQNMTASILANYKYLNKVFTS